VAPSRIRRSAQDARNRILDAAEAQLHQSGPAGLRLQAIGAELGISHSTILHHFGSRDALVDAVVERGLRALETDLLQAMGAEPGDRTDVLSRVFEVLDGGGHARLLAWLMLSAPKGEAIGSEQGLKRIAEAVHAARVANGHDADVADTENVVLLAALALFADAIAGPSMRRSLGVGPDGSPFRAWFSEVLAARLYEGDG
jgi:AcrR family transcriptional regulator